MAAPPSTTSSSLSSSTSSSSISTSTPSSSTTSSSVALSSSTQVGTSQTSSSQTSTSASQATQATQSAQAVKSGSSGLSGGVVAGVAVGALIVGALIASVILIMLQKKRQRRSRSQRASALGTVSTGNRPDEKSTRGTVDVVSQNETFDLDRLLPQPFDDSKIKGEVKLLFTQIEGHIENFYTESNVSSNTRVSTDASESEMLLYPRTRFFALKRLVCLTMLEAISQDCPSEHSLLPLGFGIISRQLKEVNLDDQANGLSWARLRSSLGYLLKSDLGPTEQKRLDRSIGAIVGRLNAQTQAFELAGTSKDRTADMDAICRSSAILGRLLLSQPAEWKFDWRGKTLRTPHVAITAKTTSTPRPVGVTGSSA